MAVARLDITLRLSNEGACGAIVTAMKYHAGAVQVQQAGIAVVWALVQHCDTAVVARLIEAGVGETLAAAMRLVMSHGALDLPLAQSSVRVVNVLAHFADGRAVGKLRAAGAADAVEAAMCMHACDVDVRCCGAPALMVLRC